MQVPVQITFRNVDPGGSAEAQIRRRVDALKRYYPRITACQVVLESQSRRRLRGNLFNVRAAVAVPGRVITVNRTPDARAARADPRVAIKDAFDALQRAVHEYAIQRRGDAKIREAPPTGRVTKIFARSGYGFFAKEGTGEEVYFHRNSVVSGAFDTLRIGQRVRYVSSPDLGEKGAQASTVVPLGT